mgnify:CR=1 FL=1
METVNVVVKLPLSVYNLCKANRKIAYCDVGIIGKAIIENSVALPKGHGRLIDASKLPRITEHRLDGTVFSFVPYLDVDTAPTIIEADKEVEK